jgi:sigma-B regulation protein RsbU (phosphoserine phosphatase)
VLVDCVKGEYMMSAIALRYDPDRSLTIANAGHYPVYVLRRTEVTPLPGDRSPPLGATRAHKYVGQQVQLQTGDVVVLYTDGVIDCLSVDGQRFGERRLRDVCTEVRGRSAEVVCDTLRREVLAHRQDRRPADDLTFLAIEVG